MDIAQIEFMSEKTNVGIIPNFSNDALHLISGGIGPFRAGHPVHVPLWVAIHLRKQQKCRIVPPIWMNVDDLTEIKEEEKSLRYFRKMPCEQYFEVAKQILGNAPDDVPDLESVRTLIKDIWDTRAAKLRRDIKMIIGGENTPLDNVTPMELTTMRPVFTQSMDVCARLESAPTPSSSQRTTNDRSSVRGKSLHSSSRFTFN